jgi:hypothetical protein
VGARIVTVASDAHKFVSGIKFDDLGFGSRFVRYAGDKP